MSKRWIILIAVVALLAAGGAAIKLLLPTGHTFNGVVQSPPQAAAPIVLTDQNGQSFALDSLKGQWVLLTFGYTHCPDVCPLTLAHLRDVKKQLGDKANDVRIVFVSVDPERDTPPVLGTYMSHFGTDFKGLTGSLADIKQTAGAYKVSFEKQPSASGGGYTVNHTAYVFLIDPQQQLRVTYPFGVQPAEITSDLTYLMSNAKAQP